MSTIYTFTKSLHKTFTLEPFESELLLTFILKKSREFILSHPEHPLTKAQINQLQKLINRRIKGEPIAYLTGTKEFFGKNFLVTPDTLIPRPETELLVEEALECLSKNKNKKTILIDVGTGSGCIVTSIATQLKKINLKSLQNTRFYGLDISNQTLNIAIKNARHHNVLKDIVFLQSNLLEYFLYHASLITNHASFIIIANLPYVPSCYLKQEKTKLTEGLFYEPSVALDGGKDGFDTYRLLLEQIRSLYKSHPHITIHCLFEIGSDQKLISKKAIINTFPHIKINFKKDLSGHVRISEFSLK